MILTSRGPTTHPDSGNSTSHDSEIVWIELGV